MALINCPECGKQVSDQAKNCPDCGYPINPEIIEFIEKEEVAPPTVVVKSKEGCFLQTLNCGCIVFAAIIVLIILFFTGTLAAIFG